MIVPGDGDPRHGTLTGYNYHRCRCELCREAVREPHRLNEAARRRRLGVAPRSWGRTCGTVSCYNAGCRCDKCKAASRDARRVQRARKAKT